MKIKLLIICVTVVSLSTYYPLFSQENKLNQKKGIFQDNPDGHIMFADVNKILPDETGVFFHKIQKALLFDNKIFVLDRRQNTIFVLDEKSNFLYSIGRPGQGPGELDNPSEFTISQSREIFVVNPKAKQVEVFSINGEFRRRIKLNVPKEIFYSQPWQLLVGDNDCLFVSYVLSSHLIDIYGGEGNYLKNLVMRKDPVFIPGKNIGNSSQMAFLDDSSMLVFNYFTGVFTTISEAGKIQRKFSAYDENHQKRLRKVINEYKQGNKNVPYTSSAIYLYWSNFWLEKDGNIYVLLLLKNKDEPQQIFCFSREGDFLYKTPIPEVIGPRIDKVHHCGFKYLFVTSSDEIFIANKANSSLDLDNSIR
jgi:hypothetical protein